MLSSCAARAAFVPTVYSWEFCTLRGAKLAVRALASRSTARTDRRPVAAVLPYPMPRRHTPALAAAASYIALASFSMTATASDGPLRSLWLRTPLPKVDAATTAGCTALNHSPRIRGQREFVFTVTSTGGVTAVALADRHAVSTPFLECMVTAARRWTFPASGKRTQQIRVPIVFE